MEIGQLKKKFSSQQNILKKHIVKTDACTQVSYLIAIQLAQKSKSMIDGELINECIELIQ